MSTIDLLDAVQPSEGWYAIVGIKGDGDVRQRLVATREEADDVITLFSAQGRDVYFGVAKYRTDRGRTKDNVFKLKAFWLDIDCGETKAAVNEKTGRPNGYRDQVEAITALKQFCKTLSLPAPTIVNSGRGLHVYWPLTEEVTREEWEPVAARLREVCTSQNLYIDPAVFEVSRILRVPGTYNHKDNPPSEVAVLRTSEPIELEQLKSILGVRPSIDAPPKRELSEFSKSLRESSVSRFTKVLARSLKGEGCAQIKACYEERHALPEPRWFDVLSIAHFCVDREEAIHMVSEGHEDYDPVATDAKTRHIVGPHTCTVFEQNNPGGCDGCPLKGTFKSPITLGREVLEATEEDNVVKETKEDGSEGVTYVIPKYPEPFYRAANGGIMRRSKNPEDEPLLVYHQDLYVVQRMNDPLVGDVVVMRLHTPRDGIKTFTASNAKIMDPTELRKLLASQGVVCGKKRFDLIIEYIIASIDNLQLSKRADTMRLQFGWADNNTKFIIGEQEITSDGTFYSPPSSVTAPLAKHMHQTGTLAEWKEVFNLYGREGLEMHAFAALTAFGAPLLKFLGQSGAIINVIHPSSGTGKTTILHMCNSVYGNPQGLCMIKGDTLNAKIQRTGIMCNLPNTIDEITNMESKDFSELAYCLSQGRGKERMQGSANELRANLSSWKTISLCSSNASFYEKLSGLKTSPDGEMMRLIEYKIGYNTALDFEYARSMFDHQLLKNYGHAGPIYAAHLVKDLPGTIKYLLSIQQKIDKEFGFTQRERFWSAVAAANIGGGNIAKGLGLLDWDMKRIYSRVGDMFEAMRTEVQPPSLDPVSIIGDYINRHIQNVLVVNDGADRRTSMPALPMAEPRSELLIRYEPDTKRMFLSASAFKTDCVRTQVNYRDTLNQLAEKGIYLGAGNKRLSKGMKVASPGVHSLIFDWSNENMLNVEQLVSPETEAENAGGGS